MRRFRFDFIALTPAPKKMALCIEAENIIEATKQVMRDFNMRFGERPNRVDIKIRDFPQYANDPRVKECFGCGICKRGEDEKTK